MERQEEEFVPVKHKRGKRSRGPRLGSHHGKVVNINDLESEEDLMLKVELLTNKLKISSEEIKSTEFFLKTRELLIEMTDCGVESKTELVVYGIGNFSSSLIAKQQLDLALALRTDLKIYEGYSFCYDPVFTSVEIKTLTQLGLSVPNENEEGKRSSKNKCIYYLPHCGKSLYNNILWSNWSRDSLPGIIIIGNSFTAITDRTPKRLLEKCGSYILKIQPYTTEIPLPTGLYKDNDVFNDISIHVFTRSNILTLADVFWTDVTEPVYTEADSDFISAKQSTSVIKKGESSVLKNCSEVFTSNKGPFHEKD